jgi:hypothetical protein
MRCSFPLHPRFIATLLDVPVPLPPPALPTLDAVSLPLPKLRNLCMQKREVASSVYALLHGVGSEGALIWIRWIMLDHLLYVS